MKQISIIIATYNASKTIERCLDSIVLQMTDETELIIIDGGSSDSTLQLLKKYKDKIERIISEEDKGIYDAWNKGIKLANGNWIMFVGADDILLPNALSVYLCTLSTIAEIGAYDYICAHNDYVDKCGVLLKVMGNPPTWRKMKYMMAAAHVASLHSKKNLFESIGGYDLNFKICADYELLLRKRNKLKYLMLDSHIAQMEVGGMSFSTKAIVETYRIRKMHHCLPLFVNELFLFRDWIAYRLFILRKKYIQGGILSIL